LELELNRSQSNEDPCLGRTTLRSLERHGDDMLRVKESATSVSQISKAPLRALQGHVKIPSRGTSVTAETIHAKL
jgi:hypothetical protein